VNCLPGERRRCGNQATKERRLFKPRLYLTLWWGKNVLIKESMVEVEFRVNSKCRSWIGSWRKSKSKDHLYPYPIALVARRTGGGKRGKQGLGGTGGSEIQPNLLWTQFFLPIAGA